MKNLLISGVLLFSVSAFSQSYLVLNNGVTLTTDTAGYLYDFGHFYLPYKLKHFGGQFFVEEKKLVTINSKGLLFEKDLEVEEIKGKGLNYFINSDDELVIIDKDGFYYRYEEDSDIFKKTIQFGGNYFLVKPEKKKPLVEIYTINEKGNYFKMNVEGLNPSEITQFGGSYFQTKMGNTYTVSKLGFIFLKSDIKVSQISKTGGNFFIDSTGVLFTISEEGLLLIPNLPKNLNISSVQKVGANYMIDNSGKIFVVDKNGLVEERIVLHDLKNAKVLSI
jgi:hypothetical protein